MVSQEYIYFIEKKFREFFILDYINKYRNELKNDQTKTEEELRYLGITEWENKKRIKLNIQFDMISSIDLEIDIPQTLNNNLMTEEPQNDAYKLQNINNKNKRKNYDNNEIYSDECKNIIKSKHYNEELMTIDI